MQYKFNVDGEWRHDEQQPSVSGSCGVVNTIYLVREPDILPSILSNEAPGRSQMEIDNMVSFLSPICCYYIFCVWIVFSLRLELDTCDYSLQYLTKWFRPISTLYKTDFIRGKDCLHRVLNFVAISSKCGT